MGSTEVKRPAKRLSALGRRRCGFILRRRVGRAQAISRESRRNPEHASFGRLIREAINGGPDYFDDGVLDLRRMYRELNSIGSNLNQLSRAANRGQVVGGDDVRRVINAGLVQMEAVKGLYKRAVKAAVESGE